MTGWVRYLLQQGTNLNGIEKGMRGLFPILRNMTGVRNHIENIKADLEGQMEQDETAVLSITHPPIHPVS